MTKSQSDWVPAWKSGLCAAETGSGYSERKIALPSAAVRSTSASALPTTPWRRILRIPFLQSRPVSPRNFAAIRIVDFKHDRRKQVHPLSESGDYTPRVHRRFALPPFSIIRSIFMNLPPHGVIAFKVKVAYGPTPTRSRLSVTTSCRFSARVFHKTACP